MAGLSIVLTLPGWYPILQTIADVTAVLEDLVGGRAPRATLPERLRESVETTAMLAAEMSSMQRQHASIAVMLKQEEANRAAIEGVLTDMQERAMRLSEVEKSNYVLQVSSACVWSLTGMHKGTSLSHVVSESHVLV